MNHTLPTLVLLAGGLATRLRPITESIPKSMIEIAGKPFVDYQLRLLKSKGVTSVLMCVGYLSEKVSAYVGDGKKFGLNVFYSHDGEELLGTGGSIKKALPFLGEDFFAMYGDSYLDVDLQKIWQSYLNSKKNGLMVVIKNQNKWDKSNIEFADGNIIAYDKIKQSPSMEHIDYGASVFKKKKFLELSSIEEKLDLMEIHKKLIANNDLAGYEVFNRFYEIGSREGIKELEQLLNKEKIGEENV